MKKIINRITFVLAAVALLVSCEADYVMFDSSKNFVAFPSKATSISEAGGQVAIPVYVVALKGSPAITVDFEIDVTDIANPAIEGEDFNIINSSNTLSFPSGWGYDTIWIQPINNDIFTGNKAFKVNLTSNSQSYQFGANKTNSVTIIDDEHPLKAWIGTYSVAAASYGSPGSWDESWTIKTESVEGDLSSLQITILATDYGGPGDPFLATLDTDEMTITIGPGTEIGDCYGYGSTLWYVGDFATLDRESSIVGTIEEDGTIMIDKVAVWLTDYSYYWDAFNTTWTKTGKKATQAGNVVDSKTDRLK